MPEANPRPSTTLDMPRLDTSTGFRKEAYAALKRAICAMDIYDHAQEIRLGERRLSEGAAARRSAGIAEIPARTAWQRPARGIRLPRWPCDDAVGVLHPHRAFTNECPDMTQALGTRFTAGPLTFIVKHELWDGNIQDHADQGVSIAVAARVAGQETTLLRFNCFDQERSYVYGPENPNLEVTGPAMLGGAALTNLYRMDPTVDGNPIGWTIRTLGTKLPKMLVRAGYKQIAAATDMAEVGRVLPDVEACARGLFATKRNTVKHNRGTHIFEAGNIRFGLEMRRLPMGDGGLAIHVLADIGGTPGKAYTEETEILAFDHFWNGPHYHYGPRNKNHRIYWDTTLVENPLAWTLEQFERGKLPAMIERAGYPGIAADLDAEKIASVLPAMKKQALDMWAEGERLTGHPGLPLEATPNLAAAE